MPASSSSSSASSSDSESGSDSESRLNNRLKRKYADFGSDSESDSRSSVESFQISSSGPVGPAREDAGDGEEDIKVLSHKEQRRLKKKHKELEEQEQEERKTEDDDLKKKKTKGKGKERNLKDGDGPPTRQNSVWVGNLSYRTTPDTLRNFFVGAGVKGEVTRVHMPMKSSAAGGGKENRGFAYVDFSTPEAKSLSITLSEKNLDGRRLLIKDGDDFSGRPPAVPPPPPSTSTPTNNNDNDNAVDGEPKDPTLAGNTKTKSAQKILSAQKQPPCPCLFLGNLGFEATEKSIREMVEGHARALAEMQAKKGKKTKKKKGGKRKDDDLLDADGGDEDGEEGGEEKVLVDVGIKKVRMGTFEDSGLCKGFAFVDFTSTPHATAALTNPRNHFLDGRKLVVEYASADAARRGGYREKGAVKAGGRKIPKRGGEDKYGDGKKRKRAENAAKRAENTADGVLNEDENIDAGANAEVAHRKHEYDPPRQKRQRTYDNRNARDTRRPKPGAALALAQREKVSIVPSEGTRLKFS